MTWDLSEPDELELAACIQAGITTPRAELAPAVLKRAVLKFDPDAPIWSNAQQAPRAKFHSPRFAAISRAPHKSLKNARIEATAAEMRAKYLPYRRLHKTQTAGPGRPVAQSEGM